MRNKRCQVPSVVFSLWSQTPFTLIRSPEDRAEMLTEGPVCIEKDFQPFTCTCSVCYINLPYLLFLLLPPIFFCPCEFKLLSRVIFFELVQWLGCKYHLPCLQVKTVVIDLRGAALDMPTFPWDDSALSRACCYCLFPWLLYQVVHLWWYHTQFLRLY